MAYTAPTIAQFKAQFVRDFPYGTDPNVSVIDTDITNAFALVDSQINQDFWPTQSNYQQGYCYLAAHYLVLNLRSSSQGISGQFNWAQASKGVGGVSESFSVPERVQNNPLLMMLTKTNYGAMYLQLILPYLDGQMFSVCGFTSPI